MIHIDPLIPDKKPLPKEPNHILWIGMAILLLLIFLGAFVMLYPVVWKQYFLFFLLIAGLVAFSLYGARIYLYQMKVNFVNKWNQEREYYDEVLLKKNQQGLMMKATSILTSNGLHGNANIAWSGNTLLTTKVIDDKQAIKISALPFSSEDPSKFIYATFACLFHSLFNSIEDIDNTDVVMIDTFFPEERALILEHPVVMQINKNHQFLFLSPTEISAHLEQWLVNQENKQRINENNKDRVLLLMAIEASEKSQMAVGIVFHAFLSQEENQVLHRGVSYQTYQQDYLLSSLRYAKTQAKDIEAIWFSGVTDLQYSQVLYSLQQEDNSVEPKLINVDAIFGASNLIADWFITALATEWMRNSKKPQLVISGGEQTTVRVINIH